MVRNHHKGPDWIPATVTEVIEVIGPVTYLVETDCGQRWKRHAGQIKDWLSPAPQVTQENENPNSEVDTDTFETASEVSNPGTTEDPADSSSPEKPRAGTPDNPETPTEETSPPETEPSSTLPRRYPTRARQPPHRYDPAGFGTNHVMVI